MSQHRHRLGALFVRSLVGAELARTAYTWAVPPYKVRFVPGPTGHPAGVSSYLAMREASALRVAGRFSKVLFYRRDHTL